ncbi:dTDP-4-amino-4,6-dideoxygalactose transaminase [Methanohalophilus levihalophilus]|uniref:DegT/DnrJ/EryC1/StrS family aminotransferase n=1 Tax=Methanohalophilus levihalophilus TaxID=1431282 RepID=UPI001AE6A65A|nr:DegT/DnrJ/EryC1/StrS family aminotransferase [Methanohalophilus levihalophilus]MBP2031236.1 dTDP-4-amino-4,6-dideoxygalactose transaminase [Methanohalophilus levihalophilus]
MINIAKPDIGQDEIEAVTEVMKSGMIASGPQVTEFEKEFASYIGTKHAVAVNSGTAALHAALLANDIGKGDEVITTPFTFIATGNSILFTGAKPVFADIDPISFNIDPDLIEDKITDKTKAIMPVHLYGNPAEMKIIMEIADEYDLAIIEDACQAHGAEYNKKKVGSFGCGAFSFYPTKNMTTGEGGIITTNDDEVAEKARMIRAHGSRERYMHEMLGYNLRMTDISAAIGRVQLKKLDTYIQKRRDNARLLNEEFGDLEGITAPVEDTNARHVYHQYTVRVKNRTKVIESLKDSDIGYGIHYPLPLHKQPYYLSLGYKDNLPLSEKTAEEVISLPVHPALGESELLQVIKAMKRGLSNS